MEGRAQPLVHRVFGPPYVLPQFLAEGKSCDCMVDMVWSDPRQVGEIPC